MEVVMNTGHLQANFWCPAPVPTNSLTRFYGHGIPVVMGAGPHGFQTHLGFY